MARKILLADDSVTAQNMGRRILSDAGYEVVTVNNGSAALKKIPDEKPDIVILDVYMPGYGGLEVCQRLRGAAETLHLPVLLTVGKLEPFKAEEARRVNADAHLVKPFEASELLAAIMRLEDKIVPKAEPRSGKPKERNASSGFEAPDAPPATAKSKSAEPTGIWKNRLKISTKLPDAEAAEKPSSRQSAGFRRIDHPAPDLTQHLPAPPLPPTGSVADITAEEIAAIAAAAAAFGNRPEPGIPEAHAAHPGPAEPVHSEYAREAVSNFAAEEIAASVDAHEAPPAYGEITPEVAVPYEEPTVAGSPSAETWGEEPRFETWAAAEAAVEPAGQDTYEAMPTAAEDTHAAELIAEPVEEPAPSADTRSTMQRAIYSSMEANDPDLAAALNSLAPVNIDAPNEANSYVSLIERISASASAMSESTSASAAGRWIAAEVALSPEEASCVLEREMEAAYATLRSDRIEGTAGEWAGTGEIEAAAEAYTATEIAEEAGAVTAHTWADMAWAESDAEAPHPHDLLIAASYAERAAERREEPETTDAGHDYVASEEPAPAKEAHASEVPANFPATDYYSSQAPAAQETEAFVEAVAQEAEPQQPEAQPSQDAQHPEEARYSAEAQPAEVLDHAAEPAAAVASEYVSSDFAGESAPPPIIDSPMIDSMMIDSMIATVNENIAAETRQESAFAAAASAGYGFRSITHEEPVEETPAYSEAPSAEVAPQAATEIAEEITAAEPEAIPEAAASPSFATSEPATSELAASELATADAAATESAADVPPERAAELAAAWAHWKHIRDSVASPQFTAKVARAAAELQEARQEASVPQPVSPAPQPEPEAAAASSSDADPLAIASIVDSVLADLRPKLMAEIAKKLSKEKK